MDNSDQNIHSRSLPALLKEALGIARRVLFPRYLFNRKVEITRTGYMFMGLIAAVSMAAFNTGNNILFLVLGMMIAALIASFSLSEYVLRDVYVSRDAPGHVTEGESFSIRYRVRNDKTLSPSLSLLVSEVIEGERVTALAPYIGAGREISTRCPAVAKRRGRNKMSGMTLSTRAPFGWFNKEKRVPLAGFLIALPRTDPRGFDLEEMFTLGEHSSLAKPGRGDDLYGFRRYARGDPVKDIHWKTSARKGELTTRVREAETEHRLRIVLGLRGPRPETLDREREEAVRRAASLAEAATEQGWQVRVECQGRGVDFGQGPGHLYLILLFLALFDDPEETTGEPLPPSEAAHVEIP